MRLHKELDPRRESHGAPVYVATGQGLIGLRSQIPRQRKREHAGGHQSVEETCLRGRAAGQQNHQYSVRRGASLSCRALRCGAESVADAAEPRPIPLRVSAGTHMTRHRPRVYSLSRFEKTQGVKG